MNLAICIKSCQYDKSIGCHSAIRETWGRNLPDNVDLYFFMGGDTQPTETATAQALKANFVTRRVQPQQRMVAKFARGTIRLMAAIICEHFASKTISMITGYPQLQPVPVLPPMPAPVIPAPPQGAPAGAAAAPPQAPIGGNVIPLQPHPGMAPLQIGAQQPQPLGAAPMPTTPRMLPNPAFAQWQQLKQHIQQITAGNAELQAQFDAAVALMKQDNVHGFRLDIEADSTIAADEQAEKTSRIEFMQQFVPLMEQVVPLAQGNPALSSLAKEITLFAVRGFRVARPLEEAIEKAFDVLAQMPPNPNALGGKGKAAAPKQDPRIEMARVQADTHDTDTKAAVQRMDIAQRAQSEQAQLRFNAAKTEAELRQEQQRLALEGATAADESSFRRERALVMDSREARGLV